MFEKYCPICGVEVKKDNEIKRFGKHFCSQDHAQQYVLKRAEEEQRMSEDRRRQPRGGSC